MRRLVLVLAAAGAGIAYLRRHRTPAERVDLYFEDGSMVSLAAGSGQGDKLVGLARDVLAAARG
jgi:hypothetical protein